MPPSIIAGQRTANFVFTEPKKQWSFLTSRKDDAPNFPLGGFVISPLTSHSTLTMKERNPSSYQYDMQVLYQTGYPASVTVRGGKGGTLNLAPSSEWRFSDSVPVTFPAEITANEQSPLNIGGWFITRNHPGVMLSSVGINGATIAMTGKWQPQWVNTLAQTDPEMVILAYGTNEAFNDTLDLDLYRQQLTNVVRSIRSNMPDAVILLVGRVTVSRTKPRLTAAHSSLPICTMSCGFSSLWRKVKVCSTGTGSSSWAATVQSTAGYCVTWHGRTKSISPVGL